ncbi:trypsin-like serine peptidase [Azohydromonas aeria]|uniref:trypsin-like serine peptidase n=1 Tax=Azohydromonas aeria TaxID=2590212 RepID=UPI0012FC1B3A|nr:trypsin-like serine protease [Azohydromonas aeria]
MDKTKRLAAACALAGLGMGSAWAQSAPLRTVSSDGSVLAPPAAIEAPAAAGRAFEGERLAGAALDARAEFPARSLGAAELAAFGQRFRPKRAPWAPRAEDAARPESLIGRDRRFRVLARESGFPYRAIGQLSFVQGGQGYLCTGFLISKDTVVTAGHCVHEGARGNWSREVKFTPALNGGSAPYGSCSARRLYAVAQWTEQGSETHDFGAVKLNCDIGLTTGWFGYYATAGSQAGLSVLVMGYAGDKPAGTLWGGGGDIVADDVRKTRYGVDTADGESGAPVIEADRGPSRADCWGTCAVAIHAYGAAGGSNSGTRINFAVARILTSWRDAP